MERLCLDCGTPVKGRGDKKYCDDLCRNNYNNHLKAADNSLFKSINRILRRNRALLLKFNPQGKTKIVKSKLLAAGYNFNYHTHHHQTQNGNTYTFCYECGYLSLTDEMVLLVKREEK